MADGVELSISQFLDAWRIFGRACPGSRVESAAGVDDVFTGLPISFFNVAVLTRGQVPAQALEASARSAMHWASDTNAPWLFIVTHEALDTGVDAAAVLDDCGLAPLLPLTGMAARRIAPLAVVPAGLQLEAPEDDAGCGDMIDVNSAAGGHRYVALVATRPGQQRRGFAEAAMRQALRVAADKFGERPSFLHASDAGRPIYARMGYETVAAHTSFMEKRFFDGH